MEANRIKQAFNRLYSNGGAAPAGDKRNRQRELLDAFSSLEDRHVRAQTPIEMLRRDCKRTPGAFVPGQYAAIEAKFNSLFESDKAYYKGQAEMTKSIAKANRDKITKARSIVSTADP